MSVTYNTGNTALTWIYRATTGGTVFSANEVANATFDYFDDSAVVDDCLYIGTSNVQVFSDVTFNIGTAIAATSITIVWEYRDTAGWQTMTRYEDDTQGFTQTGVQAFKFGLQDRWQTVAVNGGTGYWIRARITAVSSITEGGDNTTDAVTAKDSKVNIDGYTDGSPCTLQIVKDYLDGVAPWLAIEKTNNYFNFTPVSLYINSRLLVTDQGFEFGLGGNSPGRYSVAYLQMGLQVDDYFGRNGGTLYISATANSYPLSFTANNKFYGSNIIGIGGVGYPAWLGEWIDCNIDGINFTPNSSAIVRNCRIVDPGIWIVRGGFPTTFERNSVLCIGSYFGYFYNGSVYIKDIAYQFLGTSGKYFFLFYHTAQTPTFTIVNPVPALPGVSTDNKILSRNTGNPTATYSKVWYYDATAGTYTDYTTEFSNTTADNAPIHGNVGDMYYFGHTAQHCTLAWEVDTNLASNDYEYSFDYYHSIWRNYGKVWDRTNNFTTSDRMYFGKSESGSTTALSVNGHSAHWTRMTITAKGTGSPMITRIRHRPETGGCEFNIYEKFNINIKVIDEDNAPIEDANVLITLDGDSIYSGDTDSDGNIVEQEITSRHWYFDPINAYTNFQQIAEDVMNAYKIVITKPGYETYSTDILLERKEDIFITLKKQVPVMIDTQTGGIKVKANPENYGKDRDIIL
jgi:hypothetical protein